METPMKPQAHPTASQGPGPEPPKDTKLPGVGVSALWSQGTRLGAPESER